MNDFPEESYWDIPGMERKQETWGITSGTIFRRGVVPTLIERSFKTKE